MSATLAIAGASAGLQLASGYFAAENIKATAELNNDIYQMNAEFAALDAYDAEIQGYTNMAKYQKNVDQTLSSQQLALTNANIDVNYGSAATIQRETRFIAELNDMQLLKQAREKALGYSNQANQFLTQGIIENSQAKADAKSVMFQSALGAVTTGLSGYSNYARDRASTRRGN